MKRSVLVIEDDPGVRTVFCDILAERGYRVFAASHGAEGVTAARREKPDLVVMDIHMPVMDGWLALHYLKADPSTASIPVWALSGRRLEGEGGGRVRFDRVLSKPLAPLELANEIRYYFTHRYGACEP